MTKTKSAARRSEPPRAHRGAALLTVLILVGLVLGIVVGEGLFRAYDGKVPASILGSFEFVGTTFFMSLLKMVLVPLVVSSVIVGVASIGDPSKLGWIGSVTLFYYFTTMFSAACLGLLLVTTINPGRGMTESFREEAVDRFSKGEEATRERIEESKELGLGGALRNIVAQMIPSNPIRAAVDGEVLPLITFSILVGIVLTVIGEVGKPLLQLVESVLAVVMQMVEWILWLAPIGSFALMAWTVSKIGLDSLKGPLTLYIITVLVGLAIHGIVVLPAVLAILGRVNPARFAWQIREALLTAFATDSSSATLPVTIEKCEQEGGCSKRASRFVLPLGATINMDGTALYEAVAVVFLFQCYGISLSFSELAVIAITATLAAVGAAGIPSAGLVTMVMVVQAVNKSLGGVAELPLAAIGIILGIDRILDMCRTVVNVWGDAVGARIITRIAPDE